MKRIFVRLICCFIPSSDVRRNIRRKYIENDKRIKNAGKNNKIVIVNADGTRKEVKSVSGVNVIFSGDNNYIELHKPIKKISLKAHLISNANIIIYPSQSDIKLNILQDGAPSTADRLIIGQNFWTTGVVTFEFCGGANIVIGKDCMFSFGILLRTSDHHTIVQKGTHKVINHNKDIVIGNRVWVGSDAMILKGAVLSDNSVVGTRSIVTGKFEEPNVIVAGIPAKVIKRDIDWDIRHVHTYEYEHQKQIKNKLYNICFYCF